MAPWEPGWWGGEELRPRVPTVGALILLEISVSQFYHLEIGRKVILLKCNFQKGKITTQKYKINTHCNFLFNSWIIEGTSKMLKLAQTRIVFRKVYIFHQTKSHPLAWTEKKNVHHYWQGTFVSSPSLYKEIFFSMELQNRLAKGKDLHFHGFRQAWESARQCQPSSVKDNHHLFSPFQNVSDSTYS